MSEQASDEQARRIGLNEAASREMNEQLKALVRETVLDDPLLLVCEYGHEECEQSFSVAAAEYEQIRSDARVFVMARARSGRGSDCGTEGLQPGEETFSDPGTRR